MIPHKIAAVPDSVCQSCPQLWEGECRAYSMPHSKEEEVSRLKGIPNCTPRRLRKVARMVMRHE